MSGVPAVNYPAGRSRKARNLIVVLWLAGLCCAGVAGARSGATDWRSSLLASGVILAAAAARTAARDSVMGGYLCYDGRHWSCLGLSGGKEVEINVAVDFQALLLVRLDEAHRAHRWLWLDRGTKPEAWQDLRRAVYWRAQLAHQLAEPSQAALAGASPFSP